MKCASRKILFVILAIATFSLFSSPSSAGEPWRCMRDGSDTPNPAIASIGVLTCPAGTRPGSVYMYYTAGGTSNSDWIAIPQLPDGWVAELFFYPDLGASSGPARISVMHTTDMAPRLTTNLTGAYVYYNVILTGTFPLHAFVGIPPGQIIVITQVDPVGAEKTLVELRVVRRTPGNVRIFE